MFTRAVRLMLLLSLLLSLPALAQDDPRAAYEPALQPLVGAYRLPGGYPLVVRLAHGGGLVARDLETGVLALLEPREHDRFASGDSIDARFERDAETEIRDVRWRVGDREVTAPRISLRFETIGFTSGDASLEGTLVLPADGAPHPAVVVQPGSSWILRESAESLEPAISFAAHGIAGFAYDKRGYGSSTGSSLVSFGTTADDAAAAADALVDRFDLDPQSIGIWGLSQGAWIAPLAAGRTDAIRFLVLLGAPATSPARQEIQRARAKAEAEGLPASDVEAVGRFQELSFWYGHTGRGWEEYAAARAAAEGSRGCAGSGRRASRGSRTSAGGG